MGLCFSRRVSNPCEIIAEFLMSSVFSLRFGLKNHYAILKDRHFLNLQIKSQSTNVSTKLCKF